ncbi:MAG: mechanosensitive ion channel family protein [Flavisolibacter sp.]|jgi:small conductance mechanosensitive channel
MKLDKFYDQAYAWILKVGPKILIGVVVIFIGLWFIRLLRKWLTNHLLSKGVTSSIRPFLVNLTITVLQILLILGFMQIVGIEMTMFSVVIGAFGVAAGLALSGTLQNFTSGILILLLKPFRVGENIIAQGQEGTVTTIQIFFTVVKTYDNRTVIIPNSKLSNEVIVNVSREGRRRLDIELKFNYGIDFEQVKKSIDNSVRAVDGLLKEPVHRTGILELNPDGYKVLVNVWAPAHGFNDTRFLFQEQIMKDLKDAGLKLPGML